MLTIYSVFLVEEEGTASSFRGLAETIAGKGLFCALYSYRANHSPDDLKGAKCTR